MTVMLMMMKIVAQLKENYKVADAAAALVVNVNVNEMAARGMSTIPVCLIINSPAQQYCSNNDNGTVRFYRPKFNLNRKTKMLALKKIIYKLMLFVN